MSTKEHKLLHLDVPAPQHRGTLSDANAQRFEEVFEDIYRMLYDRYKQEVCLDSWKHTSG